MTVVVDASAAMAWCFEDEADDAGEALLRQVAAEGGHVPALWRFEVANVLAIARRCGRLTGAQLTRIASLLDALPIVDAQTPSVATLTAQAQAAELTAYDASYLHLAALKGLPLATRDKALAAAARRAGIILWVR